MPEGADPTPEKRRRRRMVRLVMGWGLIVIGAILGPVPILPGAVFLIPGIAIVCAESRWIRAILRRHREKKLMKQALREAERVGLKINLDHDPDVDGERPDS